MDCADMIQIDTSSYIDIRSDYQQQSSKNGCVIDENGKQAGLLADGAHIVNSISPITVPSKTNASANRCYVDIDHLCTSQSPTDSRPRLFQPGTLFDSNTYQKILASVYNQPKVDDKEEEKEEEEEECYEDDDKDNISGDELFDQKHLNDERAQEIQHLTQIIRDNQPIHDDVANTIMQQLNDILETTIVNNDERIQRENETYSITPAIYHYPLINQTGTVADHDRPLADYGHLDPETIAKELDFNLTCVHPNNAKSSRGPIRMPTKTWAITGWTTVSKETVMEEIKRQFRIENIQYACVAQENGQQNDAPHLHIQIILKKKANKKSWFLDNITGTHCNYQVTMNDRAWNVYIKKDGNIIEFGSFKSTTAWAQKEWPSQMPSSLLSSPAPSSSVSSSSSRAHSTTTTVVRHRPAITTSTTTARIQTKEKHKHEQEIARQALELAHTSVHNAMDLIRNTMPDKFLAHSSWYLSTFNYVYLRAQHETERTENIDKEYVWPVSFPDCTPSLRETIDRWIRHHFSRIKRAKCLILIGPTSTGKTSFALSLPGRVNYFQERWNLENWSDYARYSVYDDVPWDDFIKLNYPNKKGLLTQNGKMNATDKYRGTREINVRQPAIVLLNPEDAGSLLTSPITIDEQRTMNYWKKRAFVYIMGSDEYFYKRNKTNIDTDNIKVSSNSSIDTDDGRLGDLNEFEQAKLHWEEKQKHTKK